MRINGTRMDADIFKKTARSFKTDDGCWRIRNWRKQNEQQQEKNSIFSYLHQRYKVQYQSPGIRHITDDTESNQHVFFHIHHSNEPAVKSKHLLPTALPHHLVQKVSRVAQKLQHLQTLLDLFKLLHLFQRSNQLLNLATGQRAVVGRKRANLCRQIGKPRLQRFGTTHASQRLIATKVACTISAPTGMQKTEKNVPDSSLILVADSVRNSVHLTKRADNNSSKRRFSVYSNCAPSNNNANNACSWREMNDFLQGGGGFGLSYTIFVAWCHWSTSTLNQIGSFTGTRMLLQ